MKDLAFSPEPLPDDYFKKMGAEPEQAIEIIESIRQDKQKVFSANLPNQGQVPNLPFQAVVESPAVAGAGGITPLQQESLAPGLAGTLVTRLQWVETIVDAALEGSRQKFIQALLIDGSVDSVDTAEKLADDLLAAHQEYLPQFK